MPLDDDDRQPGGSGEVDPRFLIDVMEALRDTNFAHGWGGRQMYEDFVRWCEESDEADSIIAERSGDIPVLVLDEEENLRIISLRSQIAADLIKALLEAFEEQRLRRLLGE